MYVNGYKTKRYTTQKKYININVYQTNSPPKLVTSKNFFSLTWSSCPKSITPLEEWHSILKIFPFFERLSKGIKGQKTWPKTEKKDTEGSRRARNHRPIRKRKRKCYGHKGKKCKTKKMKCMQGYFNRSRGVENLLRRSKPWWIEKLSSICRAYRNFLNGSRFCRETIKNAMKRSWKGLIDSLIVERCRTTIEIA